MARRIPLPRLTNRQRIARWQRERRQQAIYIVVFSSILFFVIGLAAWAASDKYYQDNLKAGMRIAGRAVPMRDYKSELKYELARFYVEFGVPAGSENDPQLDQQKASYERTALDTIEEHWLLDIQAKADGVTVAPDTIDARYNEDWSQYRSRHILIQINKDAPDQALEASNALAKATAMRDEFTTKRQDAAVTSPTAQVHVAMIQVAAPKPVGGDFQAFSAQLKKVNDIATALQSGTDFGDVAKQYSEDAATKDKGGDLGWIARGMLTDLAAENEIFTLDAGKISQQHNGLNNTTWYKVIEKSDSRALDEAQKPKLKDNAYQYWLNQQKKAHDVLRLIPGLEFE